ncbi:MAG: MFS transporter [Blastocatellia bacterium]|nr:MFS transporter [Blastocatellia bacterium]
MFEVSDQIAPITCDSATRRNRLLLTMSLSTAVVSLDTSIVGVALPSIARSLHATFTGLEWIISSYVVCFASLLLPAGTFVDRRGRKLGVVLGLAIFAIASLWCGLAQSVETLVAGRILQGVGGALLPSSSLAVIGHSFRGPERGRAFAIWGSAIGVAITAGPIVGGSLISLFGWRWIFLINIPLCLALMAMTRLWVDESKDPDAKRYDLAGCITYTAGLIFLTATMIGGNDLGWLSPAILGRLGVAVTLLVLFIVIERKVSHPFLDLRLYGRREVLGATAAMAGYAGAAQVLIFYLPLYLQNAFDLKPLLAGFAMLPFALPLFLAPRYGAKVARQYSGRSVLTSGLVLTVIGNISLAAVSGLGSYPLSALAMFFSGCGAGILNGETARTFQGTIPPERGGMASGLAAATRFTSLLVSIAILGIVLSHFTASNLDTRFGGTVDQPMIVKRVTAGDIAGASVLVPETERPVFIEASRVSFVHGFVYSMITAGVFALLAALLTSVFLRKQERTIPDS